MKILFVGNCQVETLAKAADIMAKDCVVTAKEVHSFDLDYKAEFAGYDKIFAQLPVLEKAGQTLGEDKRLVAFPRLSFNGFHPDDCYVTYDGKRAYSPAGALHSKIAFGAWYHGLDAERASGLFSRASFEALRFDRFFDRAVKAFMDEGDSCGVDLRPLFAQWMTASHPFMLTMNHPTSGPLVDLAASLLSKLGVEPRIPKFDLMHNLARYQINPVFPEIAGRHKMTGSTLFKRDERLRGGSGLFTIPEFVAASFAIYETWDRERIAPHAVMNGDFAIYFETRKKEPVRSSHPYKSIPPHQNWRKAFSGIAAHDIDPVVDMPFKLSPNDKVATGGSCFAQHIARALSSSGLNYYVAEDGPKEQGYGVYSARYGNIYTTAQLSQLIDRAYSRFTPKDSAWVTADGLYADPFRPEMPLSDRSSIAAIEEQRSEHFAGVRSMIENMDYFVFTLGLTEAWRSKVDGAVFPIAPGVAAGDMDSAQYEFVNFGVDEVYNDLKAAISKIRAVNPSVRFIITVSPVPLMATFEPRHVLQSTVYSKSVLRVVAEKSTQIDGVYYFPSYEVITGNFNRGAYYDDDLRTVKQEGVDHVMKLFLRHCTKSNAAIELAGPEDDQDRAIRENNEVLCAESLLDA